MHQYNRIINAVMESVWAMQPEKLAAMMEFLRLKIEGAAPDVKFTPAQDRKIAAAQGGVMVIPVVGVISQRMNMLSEFSGGTSTELLAKQISGAVNNPDIKAIILDIDSPGGTVSGLPELANLVYNSRGQKPIIAQINSLAASAAYWLAAACDEIVITPSGLAGSVGVYSMHEDYSKMVEARGIKATFVFAGEHKVDGNPYEPLGEDHKAHMQASVNEYYEMFVSDLARFRDKKKSQVESDFGQGRVFGARESLTRGMADRQDTLQGTLARYGVQLYSGGASRRAQPTERMRREAQLANLSTE